MQYCNAKGVIVVPEWKSAPFWPIICPNPTQSQFASFVESYYLPCQYPIFIPGPGVLAFYRQQNSVFEGCPKFRVIALRVRFPVVV